jgi:hypothetical protein
MKANERKESEKRAEKNESLLLSTTPERKGHKIREVAWNEYEDLGRIGKQEEG